MCANENINNEKKFQSSDVSCTQIITYDDCEFHEIENCNLY